MLHSYPDRLQLRAMDAPLPPKPDNHQHQQPASHYQQAGMLPLHGSLPKIRTGICHRGASTVLPLNANNQACLLASLCADRAQEQAGWLGWRARVMRSQI
uniref:Uncharacterized protein n=1 Tax=Chlamydomonas leiostraca TaxID=1034604 RepID=A0A7S0R142_9CHLO|mmetsp:Transcript_10512/g.26089  ORF Transcript_10512/g.26089 Transcript_10512/m.26089 type:complete len:100 (+) Transcript_10512:378-677(+)